MDHDVTKKLKGLDGSAVPVAYASPKGKSGHLARDPSKSFEQSEDGLTDGADGNNWEADHQTRGINGSESMPSSDYDMNGHTKVRLNTEGKVNWNYTTPTDLLRVSVGSPYENISPGFVAPSSGERMPFGATVMDEKQLKREKRKHANRESAMRSRMRKQAEYEELAKSFDYLSKEQMDLKTELDQLKADAEKLRLENAALREQLKTAQLMQKEGNASGKAEVDHTLPSDAEDVLSNLGSVNNNAQLDCETNENSISETMSRLHQLLESSSRTDACCC